MTAFTPYLDWIHTQHDEMCHLVHQWANISSGSMNLVGLSEMLNALEARFQSLGGHLQTLELDPMCIVDSQGHPMPYSLGKALLIRKRPEAPLQVFLGGHMDTVFGYDHPFQKVTQLDSNTFNGPGVADLKGGLVVMLKALEALERSPYAENIGWQVLINPDEEIDSDGSMPVFAKLAEQTHVGLLYEPTLDAQGTLAGERKGCGAFTAVVRGQAAHAGRAFDMGRSAICALAEFISAVNALNQLRPSIILNVGHIEGGGAVNIVPDLAICRMSIRTTTEDDEHWLQHQLGLLAEKINHQEGLSVELHGGFNIKPKRFDAKTQSLFEMMAGCGQELGLDLQWQPTGGCCDGNNLAAMGLPNIDTLGVRGGRIHSDQEFVLLDSLTERARLSALFLFKLASGQIDGLRWFGKGY